MIVIKSWQEEGLSVSEPYKRHLKVVLAPDRRDVNEITFSYVYIDPRDGKTDLHSHDRPELILILEGRGKSICDGKETEIEPDMALWIQKGELHQVINTSDQTLKLATVFVPAYKAEDLLSGIVDAAERDKNKEN